MGFFDSFRASFDEKRKQINESKERNNYKTLKEREQEHYNALDRQSDSALLNKIKHISTSDSDKAIIDGILQARSYKKDEKGQYDRY